ncbi:MAG TPA: thioredoxin [Candidatus Pacearchaeota archaeon]|jgi:thioredoxin 1|nr:thioredoxin [Candidatus Pacearchaeota archaeon]HRR94600.1 thioredoxin [Candidatus Paceibacterota bacterium]HPC30466.1 thioredoxin [Candidatus Pacearchaeota archaeon]HQG09297.1 thioredoxin [Candidatus Pacearchaeota archaeon]HQH19958.1 thioredoxin [Candidatus Pacearchaeota archaeon]
MKILTDNNFEEFLSEADKPVLVDIFTQWCPPCKMLGPVIEKIAEDYADKIIVAKMDLDANPITGQKFGIEVIPTVILFKNKEAIDKFIGYHPEADVKAWLDSRLSL